MASFARSVRLVGLAVLASCSGRNEEAGAARRALGDEELPAPPASDTADVETCLPMPASGVTEVGQCYLGVAVEILVDAESADLLSTDLDQDGIEAPGDCDDAHSDVRPDAVEIPCDGIDQDCDAVDFCTVDVDEDRVFFPLDCDDGDDTVRPGAAEILADGVDQDCDGLDNRDDDGDGRVTPRDCDDANPNAFPRAAEIACNGVDENCDSEDCCGQDLDEDGAACDTDCDDGNADVHPGVEGDPCDSVDRDCDGWDGEGLACPGT